jgi:uncharacterized protein (DUF1501 family)
MLSTVSTDQYAASLARWFGIEGDALNIVAPHVRNFAEADLGFLV